MAPQNELNNSSIGAASPAPGRSINLMFLRHPPVLLGSGGMLHRAWTSILTDRGIAHRNVGRDQFDLRRPESIGPALGDQCGLVINCAAYTDVDKAESHETEATAVNGYGVGELARCCRERCGSWIRRYTGALSIRHRPRASSRWRWQTWGSSFGCHSWPRC